MIEIQNIQVLDENNNIDHEAVRAIIDSHGRKGKGNLVIIEHPGAEYDWSEELEEFSDEEREEFILISQ